MQNSFCAWPPVHNESGRPEIPSTLNSYVSDRTIDILEQITLMTEDPDRSTTASANITKWLNTLQLNDQQGFANDIHRLSFRTSIAHRRFTDAELTIFRLPDEEQPELLATVWYKQNYWKRALLLLQTCGQQGTATELSKYILQTAMSLAERKHDNQQYQEVIDITDQVLEIKPDHREAMILQIRTFQKVPDLESAIHAADNLLEKEPQHPIVLHAKARLLAIMGKIQEAVKTIELAVAAYPDSASALADNAVMLAHAGKREEALKIMHKAIAVSETPNAYYYGALANIHTDIYTRYVKYETNKGKLHREAAINAAIQSIEIDKTSPAANAAVMRLSIFEGYTTMYGPPPGDTLFQFTHRFHFRTSRETIMNAEEFAEKWELMTNDDQESKYDGHPVSFDDLWETSK